MESSLQKPALVAANTTPGGMGGWAAATGVHWGLSYFYWRRLQAGERLTAHRRL